jgi:hypothetical protein
MRNTHLAVSWRQSILLFVAILACCAYFFPRWADWNQNSRFDLVLAIVDDHALTIDKYVVNTGDYAYVDGHYYSDKAPGLAFLGAPIYAAFRALVPATVVTGLRGAVTHNPALSATLRDPEAEPQVDSSYFFLALALTTLLVVAVPSAALGVVFFFMAGRFGLSTRQSLAVTVLYVLATSAFPYANAFMGHQTSAVLLFTAFALLFAIRRAALDRLWIVAVGFLLGFAAITEYPTVLISAVLGLYALLTLARPRDTLIRLAVGATPPLLMLAAYDYAAFGTLLPVGYGHSSLWADVHNVGFLSLTYPRPDALWGITFGAHRGLFFLSPFLLFAIPGYVWLWRERERRAEFWVFLLAPISFLLFNASSAMWQGGFAVGPRYLVPSLPFLAMAAGLGVTRAWSRSLLRPIVGLAAAWSLFAVAAETIAGQSFPDYTPNPLFDLSLPRLAEGDIARNVGMAFGLAGFASLAPLILLLAIALWLVARSEKMPLQTVANRANSMRDARAPS